VAPSRCASVVYRNWRPRNGASRLRVAISLIMFAMLAGAQAGATAEATADTLAPGSHLVDIRYDGLIRSYIVHVPPQASSANALPVILNFHGGGSSAWQEERYSAMDVAAQRYGFIAVYPNGTGARPQVLTWNARRMLRLGGAQQDR